MMNPLLLVAHAQTTTAAPAGKSFAQIVDTTLVPLGDLVVELLYLLAFLAFLWGVFKYFLAGPSEEKRKEGRQFMLWGFIGLVVLFGVWSLVKILLSVLTSWQ